jgi:hypothetical protein
MSAEPAIYYGVVAGRFFLDDGTIDSCSQLMCTAVGMEMIRDLQNTAIKVGYGHQCSFVGYLELLRTISAKTELSD